MSFSTDIAEVIDWDEAMQQCGEDEEFLRELLADLRSETDTQMAKIEETIRVRVDSIMNVLSLKMSLQSRNSENNRHVLFLTTLCSSPLFCLQLLESDGLSVRANYACVSCHQGCRLQSHVRAASTNGYEFGNGRIDGGQ
jgi:hypothetical protein